MGLTHGLLEGFGNVMGNGFLANTLKQRKPSPSVPVPFPALGALVGPGLLPPAGPIAVTMELKCRQLPGGLAVSLLLDFAFRRTGEENSDPEAADHEPCWLFLALPPSSA